MKDGLSIFYTDNDQDDLEFFKEIADAPDADVTVVAQSNRQELPYALNNPPSAPCPVFADVNMPGMNGPETLKRIRLSNSHKNLPVIIFAISGDAATIKKSRELGAKFYITKSPIFDQLKKSVEHAPRINWSGFRPTEKNFVYNY